jgi:hypothetical protein
MTPLNISQTIRLACGVALGSFLLRLGGALPAGVGRLRVIGRARRRVQVVPSRGRNYLADLLAEFRRGTVAAQRYESLRYRGAGHGRMAPDDIPRRIFEEFYAAEEAVEPGRPGGQSGSPER